MATLELDVAQEIGVSPARRTRKVGVLFWAAISWMIFILAVAILAPLLPLPSPTDMDMLERRAPISALHWLGTDALGRDELARAVYGARISLTVGLFAPMIGLAIGGALGLLAGYFRGRFETFIVGSMDVLLAFPPLVLALAVTAYLGQSILNLICILGVLGIPAFMRVARASTLTLAQREFVIAAQALGATHARILLRELLPNVALPRPKPCSRTCICPIRRPCLRRSQKWMLRRIHPYQRSQGAPPIRLASLKVARLRRAAATPSANAYARNRGWPRWRRQIITMRASARLGLEWE